MQALGGTRPEARRGRWAVFDQYARAGLARPPAFRLGDGLGTRWRRKSHRRSQRCVRAGRGLDHQTTRWAGQTVVGFIKDLSSGCVAISRGDRASCLGCGCHRPHMPGSGAACPGLRCPARSQGRLLSLLSLRGADYRGGSGLGGGSGARGKHSKISCVCGVSRGFTVFSGGVCVAGGPGW